MDVLRPLACAGRYDERPPQAREQHGGERASTSSTAPHAHFVDPQASVPSQDAKHWKSAPRGAQSDAMVHGLVHALAP